MTDAVLGRSPGGRPPPLDACYPLVFFDAIRVKIRDEGFVLKEALSLWIEQTEGAKFWLRVMNELKNRGVSDILIAVVDGLKGFSDAITADFPQAVGQTCVVHLIRHSLELVFWKDRKALASALRAIYRATFVAAGEAALCDFETHPVRERYPAMTQSWRQ